MDGVRWLGMAWGRWWQPTAWEGLQGGRSQGREGMTPYGRVSPVVGASEGLS